MYKSSPEWYLEKEAWWGVMGWWAAGIRGGLLGGGNIETIGLKDESELDKKKMAGEYLSGWEQPAEGSEMRECQVEWNGSSQCIRTRARCLQVAVVWTGVW